MSAHHDDELPTLDPTALTSVTGGAGMDLGSMLPIMLMLRNRSQSAAPPPPAPEPWKPKITVDGVEQPVSASANGTFTTTTGG